MAAKVETLSKEPRLWIENKKLKKERGFERRSFF
jgi:hypothetical protein